MTALHILGRPDALPVDELVAFTMSCWHPDSGGFGAAPGHDPHMLYTCSAIQILALANSLKILDEPLKDNSAETKRSKIGKCEYFLYFSGVSHHWQQLYRHFKIYRLGRSMETSMENLTHASSMLPSTPSHYLGCCIL
jgi:hypothetical protein